jgi:hypothetical protein
MKGFGDLFFGSGLFRMFAKILGAVVSEDVYTLVYGLVPWRSV